MYETYEMIMQWLYKTFGDFMPFVPITAFMILVILTGIISGVLH